MFYWINLCIHLITLKNKRFIEPVQSQKKELLVSEEFLDEDYRLTTKGALLKLINGYEQLPIINLITNKTLEGLSARQIAGIIGGLANIEYSTKGEYPQNRLK